MNTVLTRRCRLMHCVCAVLSGSGLLAADKTARGPEQLERMLQRFPEADADKDGKLSMEEARDFFRTMKAAKPADAPASPEAEHNNKADRNSQSKTLASARDNFETGRWYSLLIEMKGDEVVATIEGKKPLRVSSKDFHVKKPGLEFRVSGRDGEEILFDNLRIWELK